MRLGIYSSEINNMTFSFSRCHSFENCKYEWYLNYLLVDESGTPIYKKEQNFYAAFGKRIHSYLEDILKGKMLIKDAFYCYKNQFNEEFSHFDIRESTYEKYFQYGCDYFSKLSFDWLQDYNILGVEKKCMFALAGIDFTGYIDLLIEDKKTKDIIVIDHKSAEYPIGKRGKVLKRKLSDYEAYKKQMYLYSRQIEKEYERFPKTLAWNYFRSSQWLVVPFDFNEYNDAATWAEKIVSEIHNEENFSPNLSGKFYCDNLCGFKNSCEYRTMGE